MKIINTTQIKWVIDLLGNANAAVAKSKMQYNNFIL